MPAYESVIGLEVHAQLNTESKLFCACSTKFGNEPNDNVCPVCSGMPGVLPVLNAKAVEYAAKLGLATGCTVQNKSVFERKNYFYPDLPKGYQISQLQQSICTAGKLSVEVDGRKRDVRINRIQIEEDAGKNIHSAAENASFVDLNRTSVPLLEIVSEPDLRSAEEAVAYLKALRSILLYLGISDGNMEEGSFRCDANVSIREEGSEEYGTRCELKNLNSFRFVQKAIEYEIDRQIDLIEDGEEVDQETRLYNPEKNATFTMRGKEEAHDYRYFPDPDLVPVLIEDETIAAWQSELPELPSEKLERFLEDFKLPVDEAELLSGELAVAEFFEASVEAYKGDTPRKVANWIIGDLLPYLNDNAMSLSDCKLTPESLAGLVELLDKGDISQKIGRKIFPELCETGADPEKLVKDKGLVQVSDTSALEGVVDEVIQENPDEAEAYRGGKKKLMSFFMGQIMRKTKGQANPGVVTELLQKKLG